MSKDNGSVDFGIEELTTDELESVAGGSCSGCTTCSSTPVCGCCAQAQSN